MLRNPNPKLDWQPGQPCYIHDADCDAIHPALIVRVSSRIKIHDSETNLSYHIDPECIFEQHHQAMAALAAYHDQLYADYVSEMPNVNALAAFPLMHSISNNGPINYIARAAYIDQTKKLPNVDLRL